MQVETTAPPTIARKAIVAFAASLVVIVGLAAFFGPGVLKNQASETELTYTGCTSTEEFLITSKVSGQRLTKDAGFTFDTSTKDHTWKFQKVSGKTSTFNIINSATGQFAAAPKSGSLIEVVSGVKTDDLKQWKLTNVGCGAEGNYYYLTNVGRDKQLQSGVWFPGLTSSKGSFEEFYISSSSGKNLCGVSTTTCPAQCKTGILVTWHSDTASHSNPKSGWKKIEDAALLKCNTHCKACNTWDPQCKVCGGTLDGYKTIEDNKKGAGSGAVNTNYRQCDCNSAFKAAGFSLVALFMVLANFKLQN